jgi:hypothetical protein
VGQADDGGDRFRDDIVGAAAADVGDEADAAGVALVSRTVEQALVVWEMIVHSS